MNGAFDLENGHELRHHVEIHRQPKSVECLSGGQFKRVVTLISHNRNARFAYQHTRTDDDSVIQASIDQRWETFRGSFDDRRSPTSTMLSVFSLLSMSSKLLGRFRRCKRLNVDTVWVAFEGAAITGFGAVYKMKVWRQSELWRLVRTVCCPNERTLLRSHRGRCACSFQATLTQNLTQFSFGCEIALCYQ
jgi:hypothetical protein